MSKILRRLSIVVPQELALVRRQPRNGTVLGQVCCLRQSSLIVEHPHMIKPQVDGIPYESVCYSNNIGGTYDALTIITHRTNIVLNFHVD